MWASPLSQMSRVRINCLPYKGQDGGVKSGLGFLVWHNSCHKWGKVSAKMKGRNISPAQINHWGTLDKEEDALIYKGEYGLLFNFYHKMAP